MPIEQLLALYGYGDRGSGGVGGNGEVAVSTDARLPEEELEEEMEEDEEESWCISSREQPTATKVFDVSVRHSRERRRMKSGGINK